MTNAITSGRSFLCAALIRMRYIFAYFEVRIEVGVGFVFLLELTKFHSVFS